MMKSARAVDEPMSFVESFTQPDTTDDLYCDDDDENEINDGDDDSDYDDGNKKEPVASLCAPVEQRRRPSLVIAGDAQALESVRTVHSPKSQRPSTMSPRPSVTLEALVSPPSVQAASPTLSTSYTVPSPIKPSQSTGLTTALAVSSTTDRRGWRAAWAAKLTGTLNRLDLLASIALFVYSYHDCLDEQDECHEECLADPDTTSLPLPLSMAGAAVAMFAAYGRSRPAALLEWAQTTMAVSWIQRMAPLPSVALVASHELHLTLVSDGTAAALAGFLVCRHRHRYHRDGNAWWTLAFLIAALCTGAVDVFTAGNGAIVEPVSVLVGVVVVVVAHLIVSTIRSLVGLDGDVNSDESEDDAESIEKKTQ